MRVLIINNLFGARARGGAERIVEMEAEALAAAGHDVLVLSGAPDGAAAPAATVGYRHREFTPPNFYFYGEGRGHSFAARLAWLVRDLFNFAAARQVAAVLDEFKPNAVHTHNLLGLGLQLPRLLKRRGVRHVHTVHDVQLVDSTGQIMLMPPPGAALRLARVAHAKLFAVVFGSPDVVVFPSVFLRDFYDAHGFFARSKRVTLSNPAPAVGGARVMPERPVFVFVGQLEEHKGVRQLLAAWQEAKLGPDARLEIIGDGALRTEVEQTVAADATIAFLGRQPNSAVQAALAKATALLLPSLVLENLPTAILEATAAGTPIIAMRQGGIPELMTAGESGWLIDVTPSLVTDLAAAMREAAAIAPERWQTMSRAAQDGVRSRTMDDHVNHLLSLLTNP